ncbi:MAG TPA: LLM class flavin-dependent oxidoreductase [Xanthobacteraceae bacterium]|nr:LLM class flavin-dependent oxidoreductase [Xanthobacteraceae bacterium]
MSIRIIGMIGVTPPSREPTLHVIEGGLVPHYVTEAARAHEQAGFDLALVGYSSSSAEGFLVALHAAAQTERLGYLIAHRPGFVAPTLMARKIATFDHLTAGRLAVHIITGKTDDEQQGDGDFTPKAERYRRAAEYLEVMKLAWSNERPFDFAGEFYRVKGAHSDVRPLQRPHPLLFFGGASDGALEMGARFCDVYAIYAEPLASTRERMNKFRAQAAVFGRVPGFNVSLRPIIAETEGAAWDKANKILAAMTGEGGKKGWSRQEAATGPVDNAGLRLMRFALESDVHDERLWMPIARATGALGNTSCLVGTPEQVADAILRYYRLGVGSFLIRGFDPINDTEDFGRELIPRIKAGAAEIDRAQDQSRSRQSISAASPANSIGQ